MLGTFERRLHTHAWAASVALHGIIVTITVLLAFQVKPLPVQELFQWNVSLVQSLREHPLESSAESLPPLTPHQTQRMRSVPATSQAEAQDTQARPRTSGVAAQLSPLMESSKGLEPQTPPMVTSAAQIQQAPVIEPHPVSENELHPLQESQLTTLAAQSAPEAQRLQREAMPNELVAPAPLPQSAQPISEDGRHVPATRADYGWLIESLGARLAELKQYPEAARSRGREGKVLLRAVIRADGYVADISVQRSSGSEELDIAAIQTMRNASPLPLQHELGRAQIAITVPLVYKLGN